MSSIICGKQCTITLSVENNKVSHIYEEVNTKIIETIAEMFGELTETREKK